MSTGLLLLIYVWREGMYVCVSITCKSVHVVANGQPQVLLRSCLPYRASYLAQNLKIRLASEPQRSASFCLPGAGIISR